MNYLIQKNTPFVQFKKEQKQKTKDVQFYQ